MAEKISRTEQNLNSGLFIIKNHPLFSRLSGQLLPVGKDTLGKNSYAVVNPGRVLLNRSVLLDQNEWAYVAAHSLLHLAFGHFDADRMPEQGKGIDLYLWNKACDIYIAKFLEDIRFGKSIWPPVQECFQGSLSDELAIYKFLKEHQGLETSGSLIYTGFGTAFGQMDLWGLEHPLKYSQGRQNPYQAQFARALAASVTDAVNIAGGHPPLEEEGGHAAEAASWFISHYPLLGALAAGFKIIENEAECRRLEIQTAAVDVTEGKIYVNPCFALTGEELKFVLAHEYLHAGLLHHERRQGRDAYLWNIACDYVINGWLYEMQIGIMPEEVLYDEKLKGLSAEEIYDQMIGDLKKLKRQNTFRGYGKGDIISSAFGSKTKPGMDLDEFYKSALAQGLEFAQEIGRGLIPAGLIEEIRALSMPPISWDVELAKWFDCWFEPIERIRSYARPSRRQSASPEIPRPGYRFLEEALEGRTFGVVLDTSGSMEPKLLGKALGAIASYAQAREVPFVRVIFCDATAYDAGYLAPEEIAGRVCVKGRGGTVLQPGVNQLLGAADFPAKAPILIITDTGCERELIIRREHAFLIPKGATLPFRPRGKVFRME